MVGRHPRSKLKKYLNIGILESVCVLRIENGLLSPIFEFCLFYNVVKKLFFSEALFWYSTLERSVSAIPCNSVCVCVCPVWDTGGPILSSIAKINRARWKVSIIMWKNELLFQLCLRCRLFCLPKKAKEKSLTHTFFMLSFPHLSFISRTYSWKRHLARVFCETG